MYVTPATGLQVPDPARGDILPPGGREVDVNQYWLRQIENGTVTESGGPTAPGTFTIGTLKPVYSSFNQRLVGMVGSDDPDQAVVPVGADFGNQRSTRVATRMYCCNPVKASASAITGYGFPGPTTMTSWMIVDTEAHFDAVSIILLNNTAVDIAVASASAGTPTQAASFNTFYAATGNFQFAGASSGTVPAGTLMAPNFLVSDPLPLSSVARTDGGTRPLLVLSAQFTVASNGSTELGYWNRGGSDWGAAYATGDSNGRILGTAQAPGAIAIGSLDAGNTYTTGNSCIFGFAYWSRGEIKSIMCAGDSITSGGSLTNTSRQFLLKAVQAVSTPTNPMEYMVVGLSGASALVYASLARKIMTLPGVSPGALVPTHLLYAAFTPNVGATIGATQLNGLKQSLSMTLAQCEQLGVNVALWTGMPHSSDATTAYWTLGNDNARKAYNASLESWRVSAVLDFSSVVGDLASPQRFQTTALGFPANVTTDFLHLNDIGDTRLAVGDANYPGGLVAPWLRSLV